MYAFFRWVLDKIGGIALGAALAAAIQWLDGQSVNVALVATVSLAALLGIAALVVGRRRSPQEQALLDLRNDRDEWMRTAVNRDALVSRLREENEHLRQQLSQSS